VARVKEERRRVALFCILQHKAYFHAHMLHSTTATTTTATSIIITTATTVICYCWLGDRKGI